MFTVDVGAFAVKRQESGQLLSAGPIAYILGLVLTGLVFASFDFGQNLEAYCSAMQYR